MSVVIIDTDWLIALTNGDFVNVYEYKPDADSPTLQKRIGTGKVIGVSDTQIQVSLGKDKLTFSVFDGKMSVSKTGYKNYILQR